LARLSYDQVRYDYKSYSFATINQKACNLFALTRTRTVVDAVESRDRPIY